MKIMALGGAGEMGRAAAGVAAGLPGVGGLTIADLHSQRAAEVAASLQPASSVEIDALQVDVTRGDELRRALRAVDLVLNTTGPFYRLGVPVLEAAIDAGTHYLDICDDWEPTLEMLALHERAVDAGIVAVVGMGASPGLSNLLARLAARELDEVDDLYTAWPVDVPGGAEDEVVRGPDGRPTAAAVHWMLQISGTIRLLRGGRPVDEPPLQPVPLHFPGEGEGTAYTVGHPEPLTLAGSLRVRGASANLMVITPGAVAFLDGLRKDIDRGRLSLEQAAASAADPGIARTLKAGLQSRRWPGPGQLPSFFALATGTRDGERTTVSARLTSALHGMASWTGIPLALAARQLLTGTLSEPGVHPPERVVDPDALFADLAPYCDPAPIPGSPLVSVTRTAAGAAAPA